MKKINLKILGILICTGLQVSIVNASEIRILNHNTNVNSLISESWLTVDGQSVLKSIGVSLKAKALLNLPDRPVELTVKLPAGINTKPFRHIVINWEVHGHQPVFYMVPHFDFHFYMISQEKRMKITCQNQDKIICMKPVPTNQIPQDYMPSPEGVPYMGWHYADVTSPEFHGEAFLSTLIYGYYDGRMTFIEPMATLEYLKTRPQYSQAIKQPQVYPEPGYYPMQYSVIYKPVNDVYEISLNQMVYRK